MSYKTEVLALAGLGAFWPLDEAAGATTAADLGPRNLPLTYQTGKASGATICAGLGASYAGNGTNAWAQETGSPAGTSLAPTAGVTIGGWFQLPSLPSANISLISRTANWRIGITPSGSVQSVIQTAGSTAVAGSQGTGATTIQFVTTVTRLTTGVPYFLVFSWDGSEATVWVDGLKEFAQPLFGSAIPATADKLQVLYDNTDGTHADCLASGLFVVGRGIDAGECMQLFLAGTLAPLPTEALTFDFDWDASLPVVAGAPAGKRCASCGGQMRVNEATVTMSGDYGHHPGCAGARASNKADTNVVAGTAPYAWSGEVAKLMWNYITWSIRRTAPNDELYLDPATGLPNVAGTTLSPITGSYAGFATAAAILARYGGAPSTSWLVRAAKVIHNGVIAKQDPSTGTYYDDPFYAVELAQTILYLGDLLDSATRLSWLNSLLLFANTFYLNHYFPYYANGNFEAQYLLLVQCLIQITGDPKWTTQYADQYNWMVDPSLVQTPSSRNNSIGRGLAYTQAPTAADGSDGKAFLTENGSTWTIQSITAANPCVVTVTAPIYGLASSSANKVAVTGSSVSGLNNKAWSPTPVSTTQFSIAYDNSGGPRGGGGNVQNPGFDPDYTSFQSEILTRIWMLNNDPRILRLMNLLHNQCASRVTTWGINSCIYDATNGTRHNLTETYTSSVMQTLNWVYGRKLDAAQVASQWNGTYESYLTGFSSGSPGGWRGSEYELGGFLMCSPDWPGLPAA